MRRALIKASPTLWVDPETIESLEAKDGFEGARPVSRTVIRMYSGKEHIVPTSLDSILDLLRAYRDSEY